MLPPDVHLNLFPSVDVPAASEKKPTLLARMRAAVWSSFASVVDVEPPAGDAKAVVCLVFCSDASRARDVTDGLLCWCR